MEAFQQIRRVVTGVSATGGGIISDGDAPVIDFGDGSVVYEIWRAPHAQGEEAPGTAWSLDPPQNGAVFRIAEFPPAGTGTARPFMHITRTIDFGVVLEGEITLIFNGAETVLQAGDTFVQRQADHAWENRAPTRCRMAVILMDGAL